MTRIGRYCIACGCTWSTACPGCCAWVSADHCSACIDVQVTTPFTVDQARALREIYQRSANPVLGGTARRVMAHRIHAGHATVRFSRGGFVWRMTMAGRKYLGGKRLDAHA